MQRLVFRSLLALAALSGLVLTSVMAQQKGAEKKKDSTESKTPERPHCVVMDDDPINFRVSTMTPDGPVYFCCKDCIKRYTASPAKYADRARTQREALAKLPHVQVTCPLSGEAINPKVFVEEKGEKVYFCCEKCEGKYKADPAKYKAKVLASYTYQTTCPVSGEPINPKVTMTTPRGEVVYFCCKNCIAKFEKDSGKYAEKLDAQGFPVHMTKPKADAKSPDKSAEHEDDDD